MATVTFEMAGMHFEYDEAKNQKNMAKHHIDFRSAARVFFDYDRIEFFDERHSEDEERFDTIGDTSAATAFDATVIGTPLTTEEPDDILFVVYTDRIKILQDGKEVDVTRLISARFATDFERGMYYGKY